jgi:hypothetical protein
VSARRTFLCFTFSNATATAANSYGRVVPFLRGPGWDASSVSALVGSLLAEEMAARPGWTAALVEAEARGRLLFGSTGELAQVCSSGQHWASLLIASGEDLCAVRARSFPGERAELFVVRWNAGAFERTERRKVWMRTTVTQPLPTSQCGVPSR